MARRLCPREGPLHLTCGRLCRRTALRISTHSQALSQPPPPKHSDGGRGGSSSSRSSRSSSSSSSSSRSSRSSSSSCCSSLRPEAQRFSLDGGGVVASGGAAGVPFEWLLRPIGSVERPATEDRFMDLKRFVVACAYRAGSPPFPVKSTLPPVLLSFHAATLYAAGSLLVAPPSAAHVAGGAGMYALLTFGVTGGHHRYFSHRSYRTSRPFQFAIALLGSLAWQRGPIWWSSHHNHHHLHSDTGRDPHSPVTGSWLWSHMGWYWASAEHDPPLDKFARTWRSFPELAALDKLHFAPGLLLAASLYACGGGGALLWGFVVPVTCCWNSIFAIGSLCHGDLGGGTRRFETGGADTSTNVWHNNHHAFRWSARQGLAAHELDATYAALRALETLGLVWDLKVPSAEQVAAAERVRAPGECAEGGRR